MSASSQKPWSNNPNAPQIPLSVYHGEKAIFAGLFIGAMLYGIAIVLFFRCMNALFNTVNRPSGTVKWPLVAHTLAMFSILTASMALYLDTQSVAYIDNQNAPGDDDLSFPGSWVYQDFHYSKATSFALTITILLNMLLADGLLLCRCCVIYSMNYWVIAFPCLMYLASLTVGITFIYQSSQPANVPHFLASITNYDVPYYLISSALNVLLTLMITMRLFLLHRRIRKAMNAPVRVNGLYRTIVTSLIESCALHSVTFVLYIGLFAAGSSIFGVFVPILFDIQVIALFLITLRIANWSMSSDVTIASGTISSIHYGSQGGSTSEEGTTPDGCLAGSMDTSEESPAERVVVVRGTIDLHNDN